MRVIVKKIDVELAYARLGRDNFDVIEIEAEPADGFFTSRDYRFNKKDILPGSVIPLWCLGCAKEGGAGVAPEGSHTCGK